VNVTVAFLAGILGIIWPSHVLGALARFAFISEFTQWLIVLGAILFAIAAVGSWILYSAIKAQYSHVKTGIEGLIGTTGIAVTDLNPKGEIRIMGEFWQATSGKRAIKRDQKVEVLGLEGMLLVVKPIEEKV
jgi:membrane-bound serine protease (ClpP class)